MRAAFTYTLALIATLGPLLSFSSPLAYADQPQPSPAPPTTECAPGVPVRVPLTSDFQRVQSDTPAVLCVFRHKTRGFPTLNVVVEPRLDGSKPPTLEEYREGVTKGYQAVGLTDATLQNSIVGESNGLPFFTSEITFSTKGTPMVAKILVVQHYDRTYTASAIAEAKPLESGRALVTPLIDGIEVDGALIRDTTTPATLWPLLGAGCAALFLLYVAYKSVRPRRAGL
jgi:hypothetical protein